MNLKQIQKLFSFDKKLFDRVSSCSDYISSENWVNTKTGELKKKWHSCHTCQLRFCPICNFHRARKLTPQIVRELEKLQGQGYKFIFATITVPNCKHEDLRKTIQKMNKTFKLLSQTKFFKNAIKHWIRTTEVTFKKGESHPHFHCIFAVNADYFKKTNKNYITTELLQHRFGRLYGEKLTICDIRAVKPKKTAHGRMNAILSAVSELSKYVIKSTDLKKLSLSDFKTIYHQLFQLRFIATSQTIKLKEEPKESILDHDLWQLICRIHYRWNNTDKNYIETEVQEFTAEDNEKIKENKEIQKKFKNKIFKALKKIFHHYKKPNKPKQLKLKNHQTLKIPESAPEDSQSSLFK